MTDLAAAEPTPPPVALPVVIVDDHSIFRSGLRAELDAGIAVLGEAATVDEAIALVTQLQPRVVLLDVHLPGGRGGGGAEVIREARSEERRVGKECRSRWSPYH